MGEPHREQPGGGLGDARVARDPLAHGAGRDTKRMSSSNLSEAQSLQGSTQLLGGHGHTMAYFRRFLPPFQDRRNMPSFPLGRSGNVPGAQGRAREPEPDNDPADVGATRAGAG